MEVRLPWVYIEKLDDTKVVIRSRKSKKNRQYNDHKKVDKKTNNDLQNTTQKTKNLGTRTPLKSGVENRCSRKSEQFLLH